MGLILLPRPLAQEVNHIASHTLHFRTAGWQQHFCLTTVLIPLGSQHTITTWRPLQCKTFQHRLGTPSCCSNKSLNHWEFSSHTKNYLPDCKTGEDKGKTCMVYSVCDSLPLDEWTVSIYKLKLLSQSCVADIFSENLYPVISATNMTK